MSMQVDTVLDRLRADEAGMLQRLKDFLAFESISTDPAYAPRVRACAQWLLEDVRKMGFNGALHETAGHPMVVASHDGPPGYDGPRVLFYGHYDVQPVDPIELWESPPFAAIVVDVPRGKRIVARGAVDDKGQVASFVEACRAWHATHGTLPCAVTMFIEGEEESGSANLDPFIKANKDLLKADVCVVSDTGMWDVDTPAITTMLRGLVYVDITVRGPSRDLHSGLYGGAVPNPINVLASIVAQLHDGDRRVQIPGFYDDVRELPARVAAMWKDLPWDDGEFLGEIGLAKGFGESGSSTLERTWSRPTCDCNGIMGGYTGAGAKTVIASQASVKLSCRLVAGQDPKKILAGIERFFRERLPAGCTMELHEHGCNPAIMVRDDSPYMKAAETGLRRAYGKAPYLIGSGGSIPAVGTIQRELGIDALLVGFGLDDDRVHSPNEKFEVKCFMNGAMSHAAMLAEFGALRR